ncbi:hypothetical protein ADUPG1_011590, partial [Aduncisulcus paluster]
MGSIMSLFGFGAAAEGEEITLREVDEKMLKDHFIRPLREYAEIANDVYADEPATRGYLTVDCPKELQDEGYYGRAYCFRAHKSNVLIISHRGMDSADDLDDIAQIQAGKVPDQLALALKFTAFAIKDIKKKVKGKIVLEHTGHHMGAVLAELCALNNPKQPARAVTFQTLGSKPIIKAS